MFKTLW
jgi:hypothetical protein